MQERDYQNQLWSGYQGKEEKEDVKKKKKTWMEGVRAAMETRHLEADQWLNRKEWCLGSGRRRQLSLGPEIDRSYKPNGLISNITSKYSSSGR
jgi:hypothetical protein